MQESQPQRDRKLFLTNNTITPFENVPSCAILTQDTDIIGIGGASSFSKDEEGLVVYDFRDCYALPGFIDSHIHGIGKFDAADNDINVLDNISLELVKHGVTTFCPTLDPAPKQDLLNVIERVKRKVKEKTLGAAIVGANLEGPFLNKGKCGSQNLKYISETIDFGFARELMQAGQGAIKLMTFAPELENSEKLVELMLEMGVVPSMGHSEANSEQAKRCVDAGAHRSTYIFNGMPTLYHRQSSITALALLDDRVYVEMICDGVHIHPEFMDLTVRCKPKDKIIGISNSVATIHQGNDEDGNKNSIVTTANGIIYGSTMTLEQSWKHLIDYTHMDSLTATQCFTINPAINLGLPHRGRIYPNKRADITFIDKNTHKIRMTMVHGKIVYDSMKQTSK